jgi:glycosyltransferase involved in cell wall biosynthesis
MNVLILVPSFSKSSPVNGAFLLAKYLHENGENVVFVSLDNKEKMPKLLHGLADSGIDYVAMESSGWLGLLGAKRRLQYYVNEKCIDVVLAYEIRPTLLCSFLQGVIKIASVRGMLRDVYPLYYSYWPIILNLFVSAQLFTLKKMDRIISMGGEMTKWLVSEGIDPQKIALVNNFVDVGAIRNVSIEKKNNTTHKVSNLGVFCNFVPVKRIDDILIAMKKVVKDYGDTAVHLHLAGNGPLDEEMRELVSELEIDAFCSFYGFLDAPLSLMNKMDIVILASSTEGVPRCLMEALSLGKTVVCSDMPGVRDLIIDKQTGFLFDVGDADGLAKLIDSITRNNSYLPPDDLVDFMLKKFDVESCGRVFLTEIRKVFEQKKHEIDSK